MKKIVLVLVAMMVLSGCSTHTMATKYNMEKHPLTKEQLIQIRQNIGKLQVGMTEEEVLVLLGYPQWKAHAFGTTYQWTYSSHRMMYSAFIWSFNDINLFFKDGKLKKLPRLTLKSSGTTAIITVTWTSANIRSGAGHEYPALMTVNKGDKLTIIGERGEWFNVRLEDGKEGWIDSRAVMKGSESEKPVTSTPITLSPGTTKIFTWDFSVAKAGPGENYPDIATFRKGDKLTILEQSGKWVKVRSENNQVGWIRSEVLE
jgi:uncharacterized protein YgiM (DUF1202 family)